MTTTRFVIGLLLLILVVLGLSWLLPDSRPGNTRPRTDLPWQAEAPTPDRLRVFDLELPTATLQEGITRFGQLEAVSLFGTQDGQYALEAYFGNVSLGPLKARVIARLDAPQDELEQLAKNALTMKYAANGDRRFVLDQDTIKAQLSRPIRALSYIPGYAGLDAAFFRERFGAPEYVKHIDENTEYWLYPKRGISLLLNAKGKEVLEYQPPANFSVPDGAEKAE
ncbi:MAG TPA: hypothetical protein ENJ21_05205 [Chromatiaceae bacterium]|nr:hypothetical protein [Chromatiaceae bacterium]